MTPTGLGAVRCQWGRLAVCWDRAARRSARRTYEKVFAVLGGPVRRTGAGLCPGGAARCAGRRIYFHRAPCHQRAGGAVALAGQWALAHPACRYRHGGRSARAGLAGRVWRGRAARPPGHCGPCRSAAGLVLGRRESAAFQRRPRCRAFGRRGLSGQYRHCARPA